MGTHPLQGHHRELTLAEGVPGEGSGRPWCQPARTEGLKQNARGGRGLRSPEKPRAEESRRVRGREGEEDLSGQAGRRGEARGPATARREQHPGRLWGRWGGSRRPLPANKTGL